MKLKPMRRITEAKEFEKQKIKEGLLDHNVEDWRNKTVFLKCKTSPLYAKGLAHALSSHVKPGWPKTWLARSIYTGPLLSSAEPFCCPFVAFAT